MPQRMLVRMPVGKPLPVRVPGACGVRVTMPKGLASAAPAQHRREARKVDCTFLPSDFAAILLLTFLPSCLPIYLPTYFLPSHLQTVRPTYLPTCRHVDLDLQRSYVPTILRSDHPTFLPSFVPTILRSDLPTFLPSYVPTFLHAYLPTCGEVVVPQGRQHGGLEEGLHVIPVYRWEGRIGGG